MNAPESERLERLNVDPEINWIVHSQQSPLRAGAILLDDQGTMIAMNTGVSSSYDKTVFAIPASFVAELKATLDENQLYALPLTDLANNNQAGNSAQENEEDAMQVVSSDSSARELSEMLNRTGSECELFGWWPESESEDNRFRQFLQALTAAERTTTTNEDDAFGDESDEETLQTLGNQIASWKKKMELGLGIESQRDRDKQIEFNRKFANQFSGAHQPFAGFAFVRYSAAESPRVPVGRGAAPGDTIVFEFKGTSGKVISNVKNDWPPMPPDSPWLIVGSPAGGQVRLGNREQKTEVLEMSEIEFAFQSNVP